MTSKEALKDILDILMNFERLSGVQDVHEVKKQKFEIIEKDLERLEKLEKVIETLKKSFLLSVGELRGIYFTLAYDNNYVMTKEEYDLLKEVLEDEQTYE